MIVDLISYPSPEEIASMSQNTLGSEILFRIPRGEGKDFAEVFEGQNPLAIDLMQKMLKFDPEKRITVEDALKHPYLADLHFEDDEPAAETVHAFDFDFELYDLDQEDYKQLVYEEIMLYHDGEAYDQYDEDKKNFPMGKLHERFASKLLHKAQE